MPNEYTKQRLITLIDQLVLLGEDREDLAIWIDLFDSLKDFEQQEIIDTLAKEQMDLSA